MRRNTASFVLTTVMSAAAVQADSPQSVEQLCPPVPEDISEGSRAWQRDRICRSYLDLSVELGLDQASWSKVVDALADRHIEQNSTPTLVKGEGWVREQAEASTALLRKVQAAIGDERMEAFYLYMHSGSERHRFRVIERAMHARFTPDEKKRLIALFTEHGRLLASYQTPVLWDPVDLRDLPDDEQRLVGELNQIARWQLKDLRGRELDAQLEKAAAQFLTPEQINTLTRMNLESRRSSGQYIRRAWMGQDHSKLQELQRRIAVTPRREPPIPIRSDIKIEYSVRIDGGVPTAGERNVPNGESVTFERGELLIEIKPTVYKRPNLDIELFDRPTFVEINFFGRIGGEMRRLQTPASSSSGGETRTVVEGVRKAYLVETQVLVSD